jgi:hypothetical protein
MTVGVFDWQRRVFLDVGGNLRVIQGCSLTALDELADLLELLRGEIASSPPDEPFGSVYRRSLLVRELCHKCLSLCGIDPKWLNLDMMVHLLHHYEVDGQIHQGALIEMNFPESKVTVDTGVSLKEYVASAVSALWSQSGSLKEAVDIAQTIPADKLDAILQARAQATDPKLKAKAKTAKLVEKYKKELAPENLFNFGDFGDFNTP